LNVWPNALRSTRLIKADVLKASPDVRFQAYCGHRQVLER